MAQTPEFRYAPMFQLGADNTEYYLLTKDHVSVSEFEGHPILKVEAEGITKMVNQAFRDVSFLLRRSHNEQVAKSFATLRLPTTTATWPSPSSAMLKWQCADNSPSVKTRAQPSFTPKKDNKSGLVFAMKKRLPKVSTKLTPRRICAIHKMRPSLCTMR